MIRERPSFLADWSRHSLSVAFRKRWGSFGCAGRQYRYDQIVKLQWPELQQLLLTAAQYRSVECVSWAFEAMSMQCQGELSQLWPHLMAIVATQPEQTVLGVLHPIIDKYAPNPEAIKTIPMGAQGHYIMGKVYSDLAFKAKGSSKGTMQTNKKLALHFLGQARERCQAEQQQPGVDPYRQAAMIAALAASVAVAYEAAAYLQWKGTRTTALAE